MTTESVFHSQAWMQAGVISARHGALDPPPTAARLTGVGAVEAVLAGLTFHHFAIVVADLELARELYTVSLGIDSWHTQALSEGALHRGRPVALDGAHVAIGRLGAGLVELIAPGHQPWAAREILDRRGEGIFAIGYLVNDVAAQLRVAVRAGARVEQVRPDTRHPVQAYLDAGSGLLVDLVESGSSWPG
ncbi:VOC family protein [Frankia sp. AiPs1]|uniref:VOC family protein n=1 Tax=Frankia sp. AiPs1 TaxID=573493 RepID=UPI002044BA72|nr:VOC family protein [Frankia sp. AiPs1]MCM3921965.1 VOC family protein [Frankia sp. AiPs1]